LMQTRQLFPNEVWCSVEEVNSLYPSNTPVQRG